MWTLFTERQGETLSCDAVVRLDIAMADDNQFVDTESWFLSCHVLYCSMRQAIVDPVPLRGAPSNIKIGFEVLQVLSWCGN